MPKTILYVFDRSAKIKKKFPQYAQSRVILCPVTVDEEIVGSMVKTWQGITQMDVRVISYLEVFHAKAFSIKDEYIQFISSFAKKTLTEGKNLKEYFKAPCADFSLWWTSLVFEKNTVKSDAYNSLAALLSLLDIQEKYSCDEIVIDLADKTLIHTLSLNAKDKFKCTSLRYHQLCPSWIYGLLHLIKGFSRHLLLLTRALRAKLTMGGLSKRKKVLSKTRFGLVTYFPLFDSEAMKKDIFINKFYGSLQIAMEKKYPDSISWLAMTVESQEYNFNKSLQLGKKIDQQKQNFFFIEEFLRLKDFILIFIQYVVVSFRFLLKWSSIRERFTYPGKVIVWPLFKKEWFSSFCGFRLFEGLQYYYLFSSYLDCLPEGAIVTYMAEIQAWEKVLNVAAKKKKNIKSVGIQHSTMPLLLLVYFNSADDLVEKDYINYMPQPDRMGCVGQVAKRFFIDGGWDPAKVFILGPLRFQYLKNNLKLNASLIEKKEIVVALCISKIESTEILSYVYQAFKDHKEFKILIKEHPFCPMNEIKSSWGKDDGLKQFQFIHTPLNQLLQKTKVLIVAESSSAIEGISCYCQVVVPKLASVIDKNPLTGISELPTYVYSPKEMFQTVKDKMETLMDPSYPENCRSFVESYFSFSDRDEEYLDRLEKGISIKK